MLTTMAPGPLLILLLASARVTYAWVSISSSSCTSFTSTGLSFDKISSSSNSHLKMSSSTDDSAASTPEYAEIIGPGRIGSLLAEAGNCRLLGRSDKIDPQRAGAPIFIATRNDALEGIIHACPENRREDLVFLQNGYLDDFLEKHNLQDNTQVLLYVSVTAKGAPAIDGVTEVNPEGLTTGTGKHAQAFANRLLALNLKCNVVSPERYRPSMFEKLIWISTYMLVGTARDCASVGQAGRDQKALVETVISELVRAVSDKEKISFSEGTVARLSAYTDVVANFPCAVKEFEWRNKYFYQLGDDKCPAHNGLLRECQAAGKLSFPL